MWRDGNRELVEEESQSKPSAMEECCCVAIEFLVLQFYPLLQYVHGKQGCLCHTLFQYRFMSFESIVLT